MVAGRDEADVPAGDRNIRLTPTEWRLLEVLLQHPGMMFSQQQLLAEVWAPATPGLRTTSGSTSHSCVANWSLTQPAALAAHRAWHGLSLSARAAGRVTANSRRAADRGS
jgi:Transcriptional regulatory protein, C terminal